MDEPKTFRKNPVEIEAIQWTGENYAAILDFTNNNFMVPPKPYVLDGVHVTAGVCDQLHSTWVNVSTGDWIIRGIQGEYYPCKDDVFQETYSSVEIIDNIEFINDVPSPNQIRKALGLDPQ